VAKYRIRYKFGAAPDGAENNTIEVEAAIFESKEEFIDFWSETSRPASGANYELPRGRVVFRVANDLVADIQRIPE
jgi:hypothetical protein